mmetsp:Transcript_10567/g.35030  ORF Transcript_10567/g.35030 Transcript_10567/m.35030 type:complete len:232 (-) Transcript_10567:395-1090(-)
MTRGSTLPRPVPSSAIKAAAPATSPALRSAESSSSNSTEKGSAKPPPLESIHALIKGKYLLPPLTKAFRLMLIKKIMGFVVMHSGMSSLIFSISLAFQIARPSGLFSASKASARSMTVKKSGGSFIVGFFLTSFSRRARCAETYAASFLQSSLVIVSKSRTGSTVSSTCVTSAESNARTTWKRPSTAWICDRKALPKPAPSDAPRIRPAMSTSCRYAGYLLGGFQRSQRAL